MAYIDYDIYRLYWYTCAVTWDLARPNDFLTDFIHNIMKKKTNIYRFLSTKWSTHKKPQLVTTMVNIKQENVLKKKKVSNCWFTILLLLWFLSIFYQSINERINAICVYWAQKTIIHFINVPVTHLTTHFNKCQYGYYLSETAVTRKICTLVYSERPFFMHAPLCSLGWIIWFYFCQCEQYGNETIL